MRPDRAFLLGILALLIVLSAWLVLPYIAFVIASILLAFILYPLQDRLTNYVGASLAAASLVVLSVIAIVLPVFSIAVLIAEDALEWAGRLQDAEPDVTPIEAFIQEHTGREVDLLEEAQASIEEGVDVTFGGALAAFEMFTHMLIGLGLLLFLLFFFLRDGEQFVSWLQAVVPLPIEVSDEVFQRTNEIVKAVLAGHVLIAVIQGVIAGLGLLVTGIPNVAFWTFVMVLLALVPLIGTFLVWAPASAYLYIIGDPILGIGLFIYGALVVSISDEYLRPIIVDRFAEISPSAIIVGVVGGLTVFGFMGLFVGPIIIGVLKETIEIYDDHYGVVD